MSRRPPGRGRVHGSRGVGKRHHRARKAPSRTLDVVIERLGAQGDGVVVDPSQADPSQAKTQTLYVAGALPGERVRVRTGAKQGDGVAARVIEVLEPAAERIDPICPVYERCGGCALQHLDGEAYAAFKRARVVDALAKRGFDNAEALVEPPVLIPPGTRRRVTFTARKSHGKVAFGFLARASHDVVDVDACPLLTPALNHALKALRALAGSVLNDGETVRIGATDAIGGLDVLIQGDRDPSLAAREAIAKIATNGEIARVAWQVSGEPPEPVAQVLAPAVELAGVRVALPMGAFLQASVEGEAQLIEHVLEGVRPDLSPGVREGGRVADLYCGVGTFTLALAKHAVVRAVDSFEAPVRALERAAGRADLGGRVLGDVRDLDHHPLEVKELNKFDAVVFDPPRAGAARQAGAIAASNVARVVAVSCNPATFARDARVLVDGGLTLERVRVVDQFTFSAHVELVAIFTRRDGQTPS